MAKILDKTVIGRNAPKQTNVTWIDTSDGTPVQRNNINGKWKPVGGGAGSSRGGSSNPTETDATKVWQVTPVQKGTQTKETVIVPEQTCQMVDIGKSTECVLQDVNENFVPGFVGVAILDGIEYNIEWSVSDYNVYIGENGYFIVLLDNVYSLVDANRGSVHTIKVITRETEPIYDYNWVPGVKIPVPTAEDEGKILVVTKTEDNTSVIVPEQSVPVDNVTPLTDVDLTKFVVGNAVKVTINQQTAIGVIEEDKDEVYVDFVVDGVTVGVWQTDNLLYTNAISVSDPTSTIKLEYVESNYEYQLQENSGGSSSTSNVIWPALHDYDEGNILATFVPEDVEPGTWCMVCGNVNAEYKCFPVFIKAFNDYVLYNTLDLTLSTLSVGNGQLLQLLGIKQTDPTDPGSEGGK